MSGITRDFLRIIRADIDAALAATAKKHNLAKLITASASYDPSAGSFSFKLEGAVQGGLTVDQRRYDQTREFLPHWPERGSGFLSAGRIVTITGMGKGGAIYVTDPQGKALRFKREAFERRFPRPAHDFTNAKVAAPERKEAGVQS